MGEGGRRNKRGKKKEIFAESRRLFLFVLFQGVSLKLAISTWFFKKWHICQEREMIDGAAFLLFCSESGNISWVGFSCLDFSPLAGGKENTKEIT